MYVKDGHTYQQSLRVLKESTYNFICQSSNLLEGSLDTNAIRKKVPKMQKQIRYYFKRFFGL